MVIAVIVGLTATVRPIRLRRLVRRCVWLVFMNLVFGFGAIGQIAQTHQNARLFGLWSGWSGGTQEWRGLGRTGVLALSSAVLKEEDLRQSVSGGGDDLARGKG